MSRLTEPVMMVIEQTGIFVKMVTDKGSVMVTMTVAGKNMAIVIGTLCMKAINESHRH